MVQIPYNIDTSLLVGRASKQLSIPRRTLYHWISHKKISVFRLSDILFIPQSEIQRIRQERER